MGHTKPCSGSHKLVPRPSHRNDVNGDVPLVRGRTRLAAAASKRSRATKFQANPLVIALSLPEEESKPQLLRVFDVAGVSWWSVPG